MNLQNLVILTHYEHSRKVSQISGMLAKRAGFSSWEANIIEQAAAFHDVGKSYVPGSILQKNGALTPEEYEIVKTHAALGARFALKFRHFAKPSLIWRFITLFNRHLTAGEIYFAAPLEW